MNNPFDKYETKANNLYIAWKEAEAKGKIRAASKLKTLYTKLALTYLKELEAV